MINIFFFISDPQPERSEDDAEEGDTIQVSVTHKKDIFRPYSLPDPDIKQFTTSYTYSVSIVNYSNQKMPSSANAELIWAEGGCIIAITIHLCNTEL